MDTPQTQHPNADDNTQHPSATEDVLLKLLRAHYPVSLMLDVKNIVGPESTELYEHETSTNTTPSNDTP